MAFCQPLQLLINFSLFQYLVSVYYSRRREARVRMLLIAAAAGFLTLMPFAIADKKRVASLHGISEVCCYQTFLQQITILTRDVNRKLKLRSLKWFMWGAELLILASTVVVMLNVLEIADVRFHFHFSEHMDDVVEVVALWFIVAFRFYFLAMVSGTWRSLWRTHRRELCFYLLFMTHSYPFILLKHTTHLDWQFVPGAYNRVTMVLCLWPSVKARYSEGRQRTSVYTSKGPKFVDASRTSAVDGAVVSARHASSVTAIVPQQ
ncbi:hypothetical protein PINS_up007076 [Pythium insidiosum]|nr:hypothetical protein PINS_up007076 [Pythium insidiosum]